MSSPLFQFIHCDTTAATASFTVSPVNFPTANTSSNVLYTGYELSGSGGVGYTPPVTISLAPNTYAINQEAQNANNWLINVDGTGSISSYSGSVLSASTLLIFGTVENSAQVILPNQEIDILPLFCNTLFQTTSTASLVAVDKMTYYTNATGSLSMSLVSPAYYKVIGLGPTPQTLFVSGATANVWNSIVVPVSNVLTQTIGNNQSQYGYSITEMNNILQNITASNANFASSSISASHAITSSFVQTAATANSATSASYAVTSSFAQSYIPQASGSWASSSFNSVSSSLAQTASLSVTASYAKQALTASHALVADVALNVPTTASYAVTSSFSNSGLSASYAVSASRAITASIALQSISGSFATFALTYPAQVSGSWASSSLSSSFTLQAITSSYFTGSKIIANQITCSAEMIINGGDLYVTTPGGMAGQGNHVYVFDTNHFIHAVSEAGLFISSYPGQQDPISLGFDLDNVLSEQVTGIQIAYNNGSPQVIINGTNPQFTLDVNGFIGNGAGINQGTAYIDIGNCQLDNATPVPTLDWQAQALLNGEWTGSISNSLTSSIATSSSYAHTASYASNVPVTSSYAVTSSNAVTASYAQQATSGSYAVTASFSNTSTSASFALSSSHANTSSYALNAANTLTASFAPGQLNIGNNSVYVANSAGELLLSAAQGNLGIIQLGQALGTTSSVEMMTLTNELNTIAVGVNQGNPQFTLDVQGSIGNSSNFAFYIDGAGNPSQVAGQFTAQGFTGSLFGTASSAVSASHAVTSSFAQQALSSSYASNVPLTASYAVSSSHALNSNVAISSSFASTAISSSWAISSSIQLPDITNNTIDDIGINNTNPVYTLDIGFDDNGQSTIGNSTGTNPSASINLDQCQLNNNSQLTTLNWQEAALWQTNGNLSVDWDNQKLMYVNQDGIDWAIGIIYDNNLSFQIQSIDYFNRKLMTYAGGSSYSASVDYQNLILNGLWSGSISNAVTASYFNGNSVSSSFATTASYAKTTGQVSSSWASSSINSISASVTPTVVNPSGSLYASGSNYLVLTDYNGDKITFDNQGTITMTNGNLTLIIGDGGSLLSDLGDGLQIPIDGGASLINHNNAGITIDTTNKVTLSGYTTLSGSMTGSLLGTSSYAIASSASVYSVSSSWSQYSFSSSYAATTTFAATSNLSNLASQALTASKCTGTSSYATTAGFLNVNIFTGSLNNSTASLFSASYSQPPIILRGTLLCVTPDTASGMRPGDELPLEYLFDANTGESTACVIAYDAINQKVLMGYNGTTGNNGQFTKVPLFSGSTASSPQYLTSFSNFALKGYYL